MGIDLTIYMIDTSNVYPHARDRPQKLCVQLRPYGFSPHAGIDLGVIVMQAIHVSLPMREVDPHSRAS